MSKPVFYVDFNEMLDDRTVLLSSGDAKCDVHGALVNLAEGMLVTVCMDDVDENGNADNLVANGVVSRNSQGGWAAHVKWCCEIDATGIRQQSAIKELKVPDSP